MKELSIDEENLLLKDLSSRLPYGVICKCYHMKCNEWDGKPFITTYDLSIYSIDVNGMVFADGFDFEIDEVRPYLRSMSSMTEEENEEFEELFIGYSISQDRNCAYHSARGDLNIEIFDWLNKHHFDYRTDAEGKTMIEKGLALEAPKGMYVN